MIMDKKGKLFSKISIVDLIIILVIIGLAAGFAVRSRRPIVNTGSKFYVTFIVEKIRDYTVNAVEEGDIFYQQHVGAALGAVTEIKTDTAHELVKKDDGTAVYMPMDEKYDLYITLECTGNIDDSGYYINGNNHLAVGSDVKIKSNMLLCSARVYEIKE